ncbi:hypothetical protein PIB30_015053 [Stylosanthes scabra]|uniref:Secreted protein n=1 Tax=Stylosanthes scabra TaxID=79078 RepID=A0ABU6Z4H2_9FABA|nr:hypothetical protein [Stylosanthes scabra]
MFKSTINLLIFVPTAPFDCVSRSASEAFDPRPVKNPQAAGILAGNAPNGPRGREKFPVGMGMGDIIPRGSGGDPCGEFPSPDLCLTLSSSHLTPPLPSAPRRRLVALLPLGLRHRCLPFQSRRPKLAIVSVSYSSPTSRRRRFLHFRSEARWRAIYPREKLAVILLYSGHRRPKLAVAA